MANYLLADGRTAVDVTGNKTLTAADSGIVQNVVAAGVTITLPATANAMNVIVRNGGVAVANGPAGSGSTNSVGTLTVAPVAADGISGNGFTAAVNKGANQLSTVASPANVGDEIVLEGSGTTGVTAWYVVYTKGLWARVA